MRLRWRLVGTMGVAAWVATAAAQNTPVAEQLFREGRRLMSEGRIAQACSAFEGSYRKDPAVSTLLNLADCREKNGQYASAWGHFLDAERLARGTPEAANFGAVARDRAARLESRLSYLSINVSGESNVQGLQILRNGHAVDQAEWSVDIPVDGGEYVIIGKAPGYEAWSTTVTVAAERDKQSVNVPKFRSRSALTGNEETPNEVIDVENSTPRRTKSRRMASTLVLGGSAMVVGGLTLGYLAHQRWADAKDLCGSDLYCDTEMDYERARRLADSARLRAHVSTAATGVGLAAIGVGIVLWFTTPTDGPRGGISRVAPSVTLDYVGVVIGGSL